MSEMTAYQLAVSNHMATAPEELREYVCERLRESDRWTKGYHPISVCGFNWNESQEEFDFWAQISIKQWKSAMATEFWQIHQANEQEANEQPIERDLEKVNWYLNKAKELRG